jgi:hypothetical protein
MGRIRRGPMAQHRRGRLHSAHAAHNLAKLGFNLHSVHVAHGLAQLGFGLRSVHASSDRGSDAALGHGGRNGGEAGEASDRGVRAGARGEVRAASDSGGALRTRNAGLSRLLTCMCAWRMTPRRVSARWENGGDRQAPCQP